jgi:hypothetical protein
VFTCTAGDILEDPALQKDPQIRELKTRALFEAFALLKFDAIALGEIDLGAGPALLKDAMAKYGLPFVCANAYGPSKERLFDPYVIAEKNGVKIAFIGIVSPERHVVAQSEGRLLEHKITLKDPTEELAKVLPEARAKADLVVLLSHTGIETSEFLAKDLAVDVVVVGHYAAIENDPRKIGNAILCMAGTKSDRFGTLDLTLGEKGGITAFEGDAIRLLKTGPEVPELAALAADTDQKEKDINHAKQLALQRESDAAALKQKSSRVHEMGGVLGAESCKSCHAPTYEAWAKTPHAEAFAALAEADAWDDPECIGCHVTGATDKHHVAEASVPPERWNVQCEECHGSGLAHSRDGSYVTSGEATCLKCHDSQNSPEFEFDLYSSYGIH